VTTVCPECAATAGASTGGTPFRAGDDALATGALDIETCREAALGWFPFDLLRRTPEKRVAAARAMLARNQYNDARMELEGVDHPDAAALRAEALESLIEVNLFEWRAQRNTGHLLEAEAALARAREFGATKERIEAFKASKDTGVVGFGHILPKK
jgi:hypothetical protein